MCLLEEELGPRLYDVSKKYYDGFLEIFRFIFYFLFFIYLFIYLLIYLTFKALEIQLKKN